MDESERSRAVLLLDWLEQTASFMAILRGPEHVFETWNPAYDRAFGPRPLKDLPVREAFRDLPPGNGFFEALDEVYRTGKPFSARNALASMRRAGSDAPEERYVDFTYQPIRDGEGGVTGIFVLGLDVTEHVTRARRQACLVELADRLRHLEDRGQIASTAAEVLARALGAARAGYAAAVGGVNDQFVVDRDWTDGTVASVAGVHRMTDYGAALVDSLRYAKIIVVNDIENDPRTPDCIESFLKIGTRAYVSVPVTDRNRRFAGLMFIHAAMPRRWGEEDVGLVADVADRTWAAIQRAEAQSELRKLNDSLEGQVEQRTAELARTMDALRQSQKMEALGQLTGGIAHDFNNLLQGILASLEVIDRLHALGRDGEVGRFIESAAKSARRAASLTHRLLAFARRQPLDPRPVAIGAMLATMEDLLRRTLGENIDLRIAPADDLWLTLCDQSQLESAVLNLVINARDAMPEGGRLVVEACNAQLDEVYAAAEAEVMPGEYVCVAVSDTGAGMSAEVISRAFEPFFTTKPLGQGTGLGLSMVYGFARQSNGHCKLYSEHGVGTTVKIYLPRLADPARAERPSRPAEGDVALPPGTVILVSEDDSVVRDLVTAVLREYGCTVFEAPDGSGALSILETDERIDLLVTDIGLPGIDGRKVVDAARRIRPDLPVLFVTGYAKNAAAAQGFLESRMSLLTKPFTIDAFLRRVAALLEE